MHLIGLVIGLVGLVAVLVGYIKYKQTHWKRYGFPYVKPKFPTGNFSGMRKTISVTMLLNNLYQELRGKSVIGGVYFLTNPTAIILDLNLVKTILIKDFNYFQSRGIYYNERDDPLSAHLVNIDGPEWRNLRTKLTPTFTSGKMKFMFGTIMEIADEMIRIVSEKLKCNSGAQELDVKDILGRFTTDVIGNCAFGINCNSLKDPNAHFRKMGRTCFEEPRNIGATQFIIQFSHKLGRFFRLKIFRDHVTAFFYSIVKETVEFRESQNIQRNDFMDLLIQIKNKGHVDGDKISSKDNGENLTMNQIAAQALVFFLAGFETSSTLLTFCLHELSLNMDIQARLRDEIIRILAKYNGKVTYEALKDMHYLDQVLNETLRKYPPIGILPRSATMDYQLPGTNYTFKKGDRVFISSYGIHHDPEYYPNPEKFDPDRFTTEEIGKRHPMAFLPFGEGPRNCIGLRFGLTQARIGLVTLIQNFKFTSSSKLKLPLAFMTQSNFLGIEGPLWLNVESVVA